MLWVLFVVFCLCAAILLFLQHRIHIAHVVCLLLVGAVLLPIYNAGRITITADSVFFLHIALSLAAFVLYLIAALYAGCVILHEKHLHMHRFSALSRRFTPLLRAETDMLRLLQIATVLLTAGLIIGAFFTKDVFAQHLSHKIVFSTSAWLISVTALLAHRLCGIRGLRTAYWVIGSGMLLALGYIGTKVALYVLGIS